MLNNFEISKILKDDAISFTRLIIHNEQFYVLKTYKETTVYDYRQVFAREVYFLNILEPYNIAPRVISYDFNTVTILMTYCGTPIKGSSLKHEEFMLQFNNIIKILHDCKIELYDIKCEEVLVHENKVKICDFGLACMSLYDYTVERKFENFNPYLCDFRHIHRVISEIKKLVFNIQHATYNDPQRLTGNQSEYMIISEQDKYINVTGYHTYQISKCVDSAYCIKHDNKKLLEFKDALKRANYTDINTILDVGTCGGLYAFETLNLFPASSIVGIDHDHQYILELNKLKNLLDENRVSYVHQKMSEITNATYDIVYAFAIIHWIYSRTELYGSIERIIFELCKLSNKYVAVEWVGLDDPAMLSFKHLEYNTDYHIDTYTEENFLDAIKKFGTIEFVVDSYSLSRKIYMIRKHPTLN